MKIGFTGTRYGMSEAQKTEFLRLMRNYEATEFHHGDCVGADDEAANIVAESLYLCNIFVHPPIDESHRANNPEWYHQYPRLTHFARNRAIVDATAVLIAAPLQDEHQNRGGTWYTIDYANKRNKIVHILSRNGGGL